jgi:hypothetical protein
VSGYHCHYSLAFWRGIETKGTGEAGAPGMVELQPADLRSLRLHISLLRDDFCKWVFCDYEANMLFIYGAIV